MISSTATSEAPFAYVLYTVNSFRLTGERVVYGASAQEVVDAAIAQGYVKAEAAPASPVNGCEGLPFKQHDTASVDTRKR